MSLVSGDDVGVLLVLSKLAFDEQCLCRLVCKKWKRFIDAFFVENSSKFRSLEFFSSTKSKNSLILKLGDFSKTVLFTFEPDTTLLFQNGCKEPVYYWPKFCSTFFDSFFRGKFSRDFEEIRFCLKKRSVENENSLMVDFRKSEFYLLASKPVLFPEFFDYANSKFENLRNIKRVTFSQVYFHCSLIRCLELPNLESACFHYCQHDYENYLHEIKPKFPSLIRRLKYFGASRLSYGLLEILANSGDRWSPLNFFYHASTDTLHDKISEQQLYQVLEQCNNFSIYLHCFVNRSENRKGQFADMLKLVSPSLVWLELHCRVMKPPLGFVDSFVFLTNLHTLKISGMRFLLSDGDVCAIARWLPNLHTLHFGRTACNGVDDFLPLQRLRFMKDFLLYGAFSLRSTVLYRLVWAWSETLKKLHIENCKRLTSYTLFRILSVSNVLRSVHMLNCYSGSVEHFAQLKWCAPVSLQYVRFSAKKRDMEVDENIRHSLCQRLFATCIWSSEEFRLRTLASFCSKYSGDKDSYLFQSSVNACNQCPFCSEYVLVV